MMKLISWIWIIIKLISKKAWGNREEKVLRRCSLIYHVEVIYINIVFEKHVTSQNIYILVLCCQWWSIINLFSNRCANWCYSRISLKILVELMNWLLYNKPISWYDSKYKGQHKINFSFPRVFFGENCVWSPCLLSWMTQY